MNKTTFGVLAAALFLVIFFSPANRETVLIMQLKGQMPPNPVAAFLTRNYGERRVIEAARALAKRPEKTPRSVNALIEALRKERNFETGDGIIPVRSEIALALGRIKDPRAIPVLIELLASDDPVRVSGSAALPWGYKRLEGTSHSAAAEALGMFGHAAEAALPLLKERAGQAEERRYDRSAIEEAITKIEL